MHVTSLGVSALFDLEPLDDSILAAYQSIKCCFPFTLDRKVAVAFKNLQEESPEMYQTYFRSVDLFNKTFNPLFNEYVTLLFKQFSSPASLELIKDHLNQLPPLFIALIVSFYLDHYETHKIDLETSRDLILHALFKDPNHPFIIGVSGWLNFCEGNFEQAMEKLNSAIEKDGASAYLVARRAALFLHLQKKEEALVDIITASLLDPTDLFILSHRAMIEVEKNQFSTACKRLNKIATLDPDNCYNRLVRAKLFFSMGELLKAKNITKKIDRNISSTFVNELCIKVSQAIKKRVKENLLFRSQCLVIKGEYNIAISCLDKLIESEPDNKKALIARINVLNKQKKYIQAKKRSKELMKKFQFCCDSLLLYAETLYYLNQSSLANKLIDKVVCFYPDSKAAYQLKQKLAMTKL